MVRICIRVASMNILPTLLAIVGSGCGDASIGTGPDPADAAVAVDAPMPCDGGDAQVVNAADGHCYMFFRTPATWAAADGTCKQIGAHLATSTTAAENDVILSLGDAALEDAWLGASDDQTEGTWLWTTGETVDYDNWRDMEPNDNGMLGEDCMVIEMDNSGTWDDRNCEARMFSYFCERP